MNSLIQIIEGMGDPIQIPDVSESANVVQQYESAKQTLATLQNTQKQLEIELIQLQSELNSSTTQLQELENLKPIQDPAPLEAQLIQLTNDLTLEANLSGRIQEAETHLADLHKRRIHIEELKAQSSGLNKYRELLSNAYGLLHRDHYPSVVARYFIDSLNQHWNEILASLDVKFAVEIQEDMSVKVINSDGDGFIEELSGGEKCCASIAFLMAVNRQFASKVGFLVLDEPTYGLDDDHLDRLRDLVLDVQGYASANGLQIIMVTHERSLKDSFHNVVEV
jgi:DNA repair exonuclease SbcCD ATPase subunit